MGGGGWGVVEVGRALSVQEPGVLGVVCGVGVRIGVGTPGTVGWTVPGRGRNEWGVVGTNSLYRRVRVVLGEGE